MAFDKTKLKDYDAQMNPVEQVITNTYNTKQIIDSVNNGDLNGAKGDKGDKGDVGLKIAYQANGTTSSSINLMIPNTIKTGDLVSFSLSVPNPIAGGASIISAQTLGVNTEIKTFSLWGVNGTSLENVKLANATLFISGDTKYYILNPIGNTLTYSITIISIGGN